MIDVGAPRTLAVALPATALPELLAQFENRYLRRELCATGTYARFVHDEGITIANLSALSMRGDADVVVPPFATVAASPCERGITLPTVVTHPSPRFTYGAMQEKIHGVGDRVDSGWDATRCALDAIIVNRGAATWFVGAPGQACAPMYRCCLTIVDTSLEAAHHCVHLCDVSTEHDQTALALDRDHRASRVPAVVLLSTHIRVGAVATSRSATRQGTR
ncbi:MAG TPA: hypothetical protein VGJ29_00940 [Vicinamibacterales bacterium]